MSRKMFIASLALSAALVTLASPVAAVTQTVLWNFKYAGLGEPEGKLILNNGALYGTGSGYGSGNGAAFKLYQSGGVWHNKSIIQFNGSDGANPFAGLIDTSGNFYGTTFQGDTHNQGNVFLRYYNGSSWTGGTVWTFGGSGDGADPSCDLIKDSAGNLYGTTQWGGADGYGIAFELSLVGGTWTETILHSFGSGSDGKNPAAGLMMDKSGNLFGTTIYGGVHGLGAVFELAQSGGSWKEQLLYSFDNGADGSYPYGVLIGSSTGALYGTTQSGYGPGHGSVYELSQSGGVWTETTLYQFAGGTDGAYPSGGLHWNGSGGFYGTTAAGGKGSCNSGAGCGTVFELSPSGGTWTENILYRFTGGSDGGVPLGAVILDKSANLYGTTAGGGTYGYGTVWKITP